MRRLTPLQKHYLEVARLFHVAERSHFVIWFTGRDQRHKPTERVLPALVRKGYLRAARYGRKLIYATDGKAYSFSPRGEGGGVRRHPYHGLCCTEALVRIVRADPQVEVIPEEGFVSARVGCTPEWAVIYRERGTALLFEFSTRAQVYNGEFSAKLSRYRKCLPKLAGWLKAAPLLLAAVDGGASEVQLIVERLRERGRTSEEMFFVDWGSFVGLPLGAALTAEIYLWGGGEGRHPLRRL
jgi:hypothetical protein